MQYMWHVKTEYLNSHNEWFLFSSSIFFFFFCFSFLRTERLALDFMVVEIVSLLLNLELDIVHVVEAVLSESITLLVHHSSFPCASPVLWTFLVLFLVGNWFFFSFFFILIVIWTWNLSQSTPTLYHLNQASKGTYFPCTVAVTCLFWTKLSSVLLHSSFSILFTLVLMSFFILVIIIRSDIPTCSSRWF